MINALTHPLDLSPRGPQGLLESATLPRDDESRLAAALRIAVPADEVAPAPTANAQGASPQRLAVTSGNIRLRRVAQEMRGAVEARLPGRIRDLAVRVEKDRFVLTGISSSYYVKQVAQHLAMGAMDAHLLGRLVNEIEVRPVR